MSNQKMQSLDTAEMDKLGKRVSDPIEPRKSGLSINWIVGCPLECSYCVRHKDNTFYIKKPHFVVSTNQAVEMLLSHPFFCRHTTPLQLLNKATDGFVPSVKPHLFEFIEALDSMGLRNHIIIITRYKILTEDVERLDRLMNLKITVFVTYSGIEDEKIEPIDNSIPIESIKTMFRAKKRSKLVLYWRPLIEGYNDSREQLNFVLNDLCKYADALVFTGLFYGSAVRSYFDSVGLPDLAPTPERRKILGRNLENRILEASQGSSAEGKIFRKTSCGVAFVHGEQDYNGHIGIIHNGKCDICDICPTSQIKICKAGMRKPTREGIIAELYNIGLSELAFDILDGCVVVEHLPSESVRYYLQHKFKYQFHDKDYPHLPNRHGRANIGWEALK